MAARGSRHYPRAAAECPREKQTWKPSPQQTKLRFRSYWREWDYGQLDSCLEVSEVTQIQMVKLETVS